VAEHPVLILIAATRAISPSRQCSVHRMPRTASPLPMTLYRPWIGLPGFSAIRGSF